MGNGRTINIGAGGVQFLTEMPMLFGEQLRLALVLTSRDIVVVGGTIVRIEDGDEPKPATALDAAAESSPATPVAHSKVAVRFDKISEIDQERITCHILSAHRQRSIAAAPEALKVQVSAAGPPSEPDPAP